MGFKEVNGYRYIDLRQDLRLNVGHDVPDAMTSMGPGGRTGWCWQTSLPTATPLFGMSGSTHCSLLWSSYEKVIRVTIERIFEEGIGVCARQEHTKSERLKEKIKRCSMSTTENVLA